MIDTIIFTIIVLYYLLSIVVALFMGKSGKARKRKRDQERIIDVAQDLSDASDRDEHVAPHVNDVATAISVFDCLTRNRDELHAKGLKLLRKALFPLLEVQKTKHFEKDPTPPPLSAVEVEATLTEARISATIRAAVFFGHNPEVFQSPDYKKFRRALHPIVDIYFGRDTCSDQALSNTVSQLFRVRDWDAALRALYALISSDSEVPKLGTLQRWVRECDSMHADSATDQYSSTYLLVLDAVMRVMLMRQADVEKIKYQMIGKFSFCPNRKGELVSFPIFSPSISPSPNTLIESLNEDVFRSNVWIASTVPGCQRRPPVEIDLNVFALRTGAINLGSTSNYNYHRHDVLGVAGSFLLSNILTKAECEKLINAAECLGYSSDVAVGIDNVTLIADEYLVGEIFERVKLLLPPFLCGCKLAGINARFRFFRYFSGT